MQTQEKKTCVINPLFR